MQHNIEEKMRDQDIYWRRVRRLTFRLLAIWFVATFGVIFFARELSGLNVLGWPLSFYMAAQGLTLLYVALVAFYMIRMRRLDKLIRSEAIDAE